MLKVFLMLMVAGILTANARDGLTPGNRVIVGKGAAYTILEEDLDVYRESGFFRKKDEKEHRWQIGNKLYLVAWMPNDEEAVVISRNGNNVKVHVLTDADKEGTIWVDSLDLDLPLDASHGSEAARESTL